MTDENPELVISKKTLDVLERVSIASFIKSVSEYPIVTRKLLLIRQKKPRKWDPASKLWKQDPTEILHEAAERVKTKALSKGWAVDDLSGNNATKQNILNAFQKKPDFILYYGHCCGTNCAHICGQENDVSVPAIGLYAGPNSTSNVNLISGLSVSATACITASNLGLEAIKKKTRAYLGYTALLTSVSFANTVKNFPVPTMANASPSEKVILDAQEDFIECVNSYNIALLEGMTYKDAWKIGDETYAKKWNKWKSMCVPPEKRTDFGKKICPWLKDTFNQNRMIFVRLGIPIAVARPIGIVINP